jgi:hypothetical protein
MQSSTIRKVIVVSCMLWTGSGLLAKATQQELISNGALTGTGQTPSGWYGWSEGSHDPDSGTYRSAPNSWTFWWDGGLFQDSSNVRPGDWLHASGYLYTPSWDKLRNGSKTGTLELEFYDVTGGLISAVAAWPSISSNSPADQWIAVSVEASVPANAMTARLVVRCSNASSGDGRFMVDDVSINNESYLPNMLKNPSLNYVSGLAPVDWLSWDYAHGVSTNVVRTGSSAWMVWDEGGIYQDITEGFVVSNRLEFGYWMYHPSWDPLTTNACSQMRIVFYNAQNQVIEINWAMPYLTSSSARDTWQLSRNTSRVPVGCTRIRIEIRQHSWEYGTGRFMADDAFLVNHVHDDTILINPVLSGSGNSPDHWSQWNDGSHDPETGTARSPLNSWTFWWDGGIYQDVSQGFDEGYPLKFGAYLRMPSWDSLRNGSKHGSVVLEFYDGGDLISSVMSTGTIIHAGSPQDQWIRCEGSGSVPEGTTTARLLIRCDNAWSGDGRFMADDAFLIYEGPKPYRFSSYYGDPLLRSPYSYGRKGGKYGSQELDDLNPTNMAFLHNGDIMRLWGNNWKQIYILQNTSNYTVTADTVLEFEFKSDGEQAEINGVGLDTGAWSSLAVSNMFQVYGTETSGIQDYNDYEGNGWKSYRIPVGQYYQGPMRVIFFANDADAGQNTSVYYRKVRLLEDP